MVEESDNNRAGSPLFPEDLRGKRIVVLGAGLSGRAATHLLARHDAEVVLTDDDPTSIEPGQIDQAVASHVKLVVGGACADLADKADGVVTSPGVRLTHPLLARARERGVPVIGELELGSRFVHAPMIAVTGTNGKTTTVHWIAHLLAKAGKRTVVCGNVGTALCDVVDQKPDWFVVEVSSYQLETVVRFHPRVAIILNLSADHLERHPSKEEYLVVKARIAANQDCNDVLVLNADDSAVWSVGQRSAASVWGFSLCQSLERGVYLGPGVITVRGSPDATALPILDKSKICLPGWHNFANALAAVATAWNCGAGTDAIAEGLQDFPGVEHRLERVRLRRGVWFINDSKATNLASLAVALCSFSCPIVLIAGGRGKGAPYEPMLPLVVSRVHNLVVLGEEAERIETAWGSHVPTWHAAHMEEAVSVAADLASPGDVVLLSPACASFDMYRNFEERGCHFKQIVMRLEE